ncbi:MAG TPA: nitroreductase family protein [archaeon]|nr:nitroreductase family protein [archaeon]
METLEALRGRRSIRHYQATPVEREVIEKVVDAGRLAATGRGVEPWEFLVVTDAATRGKLAGLCDYGKFIAEAPVCLVVLCRETKYYLEDGSAASQNMLVAAYALGLGTCWVAGDKKPYANRITKMLEVPKNYKLVSLVALGYPSPDQPPRKAKRKIEEVIHWEKFE